MLVSSAFWIVVGVVGIAVYGLVLAFGQSDSEETAQTHGLISDANLSDDDIDKAMWEAGKHDIAKQVDVPIVPKLKVRETRTPEQIQEEENVDKGTALAMSGDEWDGFMQPFSTAPFYNISSRQFLDLSTVNPATGLPMIGGMGGLDAAGNAFGFGDDDTLLNDTVSDLHNDDSWHRYSFDD